MLGRRRYGWLHPVASAEVYFGFDPLFSDADAGGRPVERCCDPLPVARLDGGNREGATQTWSLSAIACNAKTNE